MLNETKRAWMDGKQIMILCSGAGGEAPRNAGHRSGSYARKSFVRRGGLGADPDSYLMLVAHPACLPAPLPPTNRTAH